jgi:hypothetical protein
MGILSRLFGQKKESATAVERHGPTKPLGPTSRETTIEGHRVVYDLAGMNLHLELPEYEDGSAEQPLQPLADRDPGLISAAMLAQKAKIFDDGLYAAIELAADAGLGDCPGKRALVAHLAAAVEHSRAGPAVEMMLGAAALDDPARKLPASARRALDDFLGDRQRSKPLGFYTWSKDLERIFQRDRYLQTELDPPAELEMLLAALGPHRRAYDTHLLLSARLTNTLVERVSLFPPSIAPETELMKKLYGNRPIPDDFDLASELVKRIRAKELSLEPSANSGWYEHQLYALEPLLVLNTTPEGARLITNEEYDESLVSLFIALYALTRETHVKQLEDLRAGAAAPDVPKKKILWLEPSLRVEPLATHYLRRADSYRFVRTVLDDIFGPREIAVLHRLTEDGPVERDLGGELDDMEQLFRAAGSVALDDLGLGDGTAQMPSLKADPDLERDLRMMVPIFFDLERRLTKVWIFLGWRSRRLSAYFDDPPRSFQVFGHRGTDITAKVDVQCGWTSFSRWEPVVAELYVDRLLDRKEVRAVCDRYKTEREILDHLRRG